MHCLDGGLILVDHRPQIFARADSCSPCVWPIFGLILAAVARMSLASPSGDRVGLVPLYRVAGGRGLATQDVSAIHQRSIYLAETGFPALGQSVLQLVRCVLCTVLKAGTRMWERVCDQLRDTQDNFGEGKILNGDPFVSSC